MAAEAVGRPELSPASNAPRFPGSDVKDARLVVEARMLCGQLRSVRDRLVDLRDNRGHTAQDVAHYREVLDAYDKHWRTPDGKFAGAVERVNPAIQAQASSLFNECFDILELLAGTAEDMEPAMKTIHERLVSIHRQLGEMRAKRGHTFRDLAPLQSELDAVDSGRDQGVFAGSPQTKVPRGQAVCAELLDANYNLLSEALDTAVDMPPDMQALTKQLSGIRRALLRVRDAKGHTEQDFHHYQNMLDAIDTRYRESGDVYCGNRSEGRIPEGQAVASDLKAGCYKLVEQLKDTAGQVGAEVLPIYEELRGVHSALAEMRRDRGARHTAAQIRPLQERLDAIDTARAMSDGIFGGSLQHVPAGQAACRDLLERSYKLVEELYYNAVDTAEEASGGAAATSGKGVPASTAAAAAPSPQKSQPQQAASQQPPTVA